MHPAERGARLLIVGAWMALISYWSSQGNLPIDQPIVAEALHGFQHKLAHLIAFGLLALLARWAFSGLDRSAVLAILLTSLFGAIDEWHQSFTPGRHSGIDDWAFDTLFAAIPVILMSRLTVTRFRPIVRALAPLAVSVAFVVAVGLAVRPALSGVLDNVGLRQAAHAAVQLVRETRNVARQVRATVSG